LYSPFSLTPTPSQTPIGHAHLQAPPFFCNDLCGQKHKAGFQLTESTPPPTLTTAVFPKTNLLPSVFSSTCPPKESEQTEIASLKEDPAENNSSPSKKENKQRDLADTNTSPLFPLIEKRKRFGDRNTLTVPCDSSATLVLPDCSPPACFVPGEGIPPGHSSGITTPSCATPESQPLLSCLSPFDSSSDERKIVGGVPNKSFNINKRFSRDRPSSPLVFFDSDYDISKSEQGHVEQSPSSSSIANFSPLSISLELTHLPSQPFFSPPFLPAPACSLMNGTGHTLHCSLPCGSCDDGTRKKCAHSQQRKSMTLWERLHPSAHNCVGDSILLRQGQSGKMKSVTFKDDEVTLPNSPIEQNSGVFDDSCSSLDSEDTTAQRFSARTHLDCSSSGYSHSLSFSTGSISATSPQFNISPTFKKEEIEGVDLPSEVIRESPSFYKRKIKMLEPIYVPTSAFENDLSSTCTIV
jgi:hypothetical protein